eukprot:TRINITY_DN1529_c0_g1_i2.p1 TRINITY_DN1529_c0_g1~~TRINITY_DN1529_c0_g1_i2.p1  ORF type:complete len:738 (-),score=244.51 TRINITY_DN1529_c0_g1_i2:51-1970(-)
MRITNFHHDISDGVALINLMEILSGKSVREYHQNPITVQHKLQNCDIVIQFLHKFNVKTNARPKDIYHGNMAVLFGAVYQLIEKVMNRVGKVRAMKRKKRIASVMVTNKRFSLYTGLYNELMAKKGLEELHNEVAKSKALQANSLSTLAEEEEGEPTTTSQPTTETTNNESDKELTTPSSPTKPTRQWPPPAKKRTTVDVNLSQNTSETSSSSSVSALISPRGQSTSSPNRKWPPVVKKAVSSTNVVSPSTDTLRRAVSEQNIHSNRTDSGEESSSSSTTSTTTSQSSPGTPTREWPPKPKSKPTTTSNTTATTTPTTTTTTPTTTPATATTTPATATTTPSTATTTPLPPVVNQSDSTPRLWSVKPSKTSRNTGSSVSSEGSSSSSSSSPTSPRTSKESESSTSTAQTSRPVSTTTTQDGTKPTKERPTSVKPLPKPPTKKSDLSSSSSSSSSSQQMSVNKDNKTQNHKSGTPDTFDLDTFGGLDLLSDGDAKLTEEEEMALERSLSSINSISFDGIDDLEMIDKLFSDTLSKVESCFDDNNVVKNNEGVNINSSIEAYKLEINEPASDDVLFNVDSTMSDLKSFISNIQAKSETSDASQTNTNANTFELDDVDEASLTLNIVWDENDAVDDFDWDDF